MSIIVTSDQTRVRAWVNIISKMKGRDPLFNSSILYTTINRPARISHNHRRHGKLGLQLSFKKESETYVSYKETSGHMVFKRFPHW